MDTFYKWLVGISVFVSILLVAGVLIYRQRSSGDFRTLHSLESEFVTTFALSPDGNALATCGLSNVSLKHRNIPDFAVWDVEHLIAAQSEIISDDGLRWCAWFSNTLALGLDYGNTLYLIHTNKPIEAINLPDRICHVSVSSNHKHILVALQSNELYQIDIETQKPTLLRQFGADLPCLHHFWVNDAVVLSAYSSDTESTLLIWDTTTGDMLQEYKRPPFNHIQFSNPLLVTSYQNMLSIYDSQTHNEIVQQTFDETVTDFAISDQTLVVAVDHTATRWEIADTLIQRGTHTLRGDIFDLAIATDQQTTIIGYRGTQNATIVVTGVFE